MLYLAELVGISVLVMGAWIGFLLGLEWLADLFI